MVWVGTFRWWEEKTTRRAVSYREQSKEERGGTCGRRQHLGGSTVSKYSFSKESCMPKCCSKMHMKMRYGCQG